MKFQRLLMIIFYLRIHNKVTINELSKYLEVSKRTICRDIEILRTSGAEIESCVGKIGGYKLSEDFSFEKIIFSKSELSSILLSTKLLGQFKETEFAKEAAVLSSKIERLLYKDSKPGSKASDFLLVDTEAEGESNSIQQILHCVETAYDTNKLLFIEYKSPFCKRLSTANYAAPYGLVNKAGFWHFVGFCYELKSFRVFNVLLINKINVTEETFTRDKNFDLDKFWESQKQD